MEPVEVGASTGFCCPSNSIGLSIRLAHGMMWVRIPPGALGGVAERPKASVLDSDEAAQVSAGSNPAAPANQTNPCNHFHR